MQHRVVPIASFFLILSIYFRWLPIRAGLLFYFAATSLLIVNLRKPILNSITKTLAIFAAFALAYFARFFFEITTNGYHQVFTTDLLNIFTVLLTCLLLQKISLELFSEKLSNFEIYAGVLFTAYPFSKLLLSFFSLSPDSLSYSVLGHLMSFNFDYNVYAFLLIISFASLMYANLSFVKTNLYATLFTYGVVISSSRRAFLLLLALACAFLFLGIFKSKKKCIAASACAILFSLALLVSAATLPKINGLFSNDYVRAFISENYFAPLLRHYSIVMKPKEFDEMYYATLYDYDDNAKSRALSIVNNAYRHTSGRTHFGEVAMTPRLRLLEASAEIIETEFSWYNHIFGKSFFIRDMGKKVNLAIEYPHNFLISAYMTFGALGLLILFAMYYFAIKGFAVLMLQSFQVKLAIATLFALTSGLSFWSFLYLPIIVFFGLALYENHGIRTSRDHIN